MDKEWIELDKMLKESDLADGQYYLIKEYVEKLLNNIAPVEGGGKTLREALRRIAYDCDVEEHTEIARNAGERHELNNQNNK
jgi:hypothetical protein